MRRIISASGKRTWLDDERRHRDDGPAVEWADGSKEWWVHGRIHRVEGPAIEMSDGYRGWLQNDTIAAV